MQFVSATPLVHQFKSGRFQASEVGPYFMASTTVTAALWIFGFGQPGVWSVGGRVASVVITVFGLLHLKERNLGTYGNEFFYKYFCLGWVVTVRMFLLMGAFGLVLGAFGFGRDGSDAPWVAIGIAALEIAYYVQLGDLFARSNSRHAWLISQSLGSTDPTT